MSGVHNLEQAEKNGKEQITNEDLKEAGRGPMAGNSPGATAQQEAKEAQGK